MFPFMFPFVPDMTLTLMPSSFCVIVRDNKKPPASLIQLWGRLQYPTDDYLLRYRSTGALSTTVSSVLCWDPVTLLKMDGELLKYSSRAQRKQVWSGPNRQLPESLQGHVVQQPTLQLETHIKEQKKNKVRLTFCASFTVHR